LAIDGEGEEPHDRAPDGPVHEADPELLEEETPEAARADLIEGQPADHERHGLVAGIASDTRNDRHERGERHELVDGAFEGADHP